MKLPKNRIALAVFVVLGVAALVYAFMPAPVAVETAEAGRGPLEVTVRDDGRTRIKERYVVSSPLAGQLQRIRLKPGHEVEAGRTLLAAVEPFVPELLDPRTVAMAEARVRAADAALQRAKAFAGRARANHDYAQAEVERSRELFAVKAISRSELDRAEVAARSAQEELNSAEHAVRIAGYELEQARAALLRTQPDAQAGEQFEIRSPISGKVLRVFQESASAVAPGTALLEVGDPQNLEIEIDVLSVDAVNIRPGAKVWLEFWGGPQPIEARVRVIEPSGFTKISALGVEEQRVWVIADFAAPREQWESLGDAYRVEARIVTWESDDVLKVPAGALFRAGAEWAVFVVADGRARLRRVQMGRRGEQEAEVLGGISEGEWVIVHPSDRISDGVAITARRKP
jgi:HlyD family secretion protein